VSEEKRRRFCTVDHAGKQRDAVNWDDQRFWLALARRRRAFESNKHRPAGTADDRRGER